MTSNCISFVDQGVGDPLVLIMGLGAPGSRWQPHIDAWREHFRCIAVDNRGTGGTPMGERPPTTRDLADDIVSLIRDLGVGPVRVVGISMGACIAQELMLAEPDLVSKAVLVAPWAHTPPSAVDRFEVLRRAQRSGDTRLFNTALRSIIWTPSWIDGHADEMERDLDAPPSMSVDAFAHQVYACTTHDTVSRLHQVRTPTLVTWGTQDVFVPPVLSSDVARLIPGAEAIVFGTGHVHHWEELDRFNRTIERWLH